MNPRRYILLVLLLGSGLIVVVAAFNAAVDPYAIFGAPRVAGFNQIKPHAGDRGRTSKVHQVMRVRPRTAIVGNSRPEMGLDPTHACWPGPARPVYNLAVPGLTVYRQMRLAQHALADEALQSIYMGVDFPDFLESAPRHDPAAWPPPAEAALRLRVDPSGAPRAVFAPEAVADRLRASFSLGSLFHSLATIAAQNDRWTETRTPLGFNPAERFYRPIVRREGTAVLFAQKNAELAARLAPPQTLYYPGADWSVEFEALERLAAAAGKRRVDLHFFFNPYHAEFLLMIEAAGYWTVFEEWKTQVVRLASRYGVPVRDFALFDRYATEPVDALPARGAALRWFWEPAHYRRELGDLMLQDLLREHCPHGDAAPVGVTLEVANLAAELAAVRARRDRFAADHPGVRARIERSVAAARAQAGRSGTRTRTSSPSPVTR